MKIMQQQKLFVFDSMIFFRWCLVPHAASHMTHVEWNDTKHEINFNATSHFLCSFLFSIACTRSLALWSELSCFVCDYGFFLAIFKGKCYAILRFISDSTVICLGAHDDLPSVKTAQQT